MPRRVLTDHDPAGGGPGAPAIPTWQAAGLSLAVIGAHVLNGSGALAFALLSIGVIWTLHRLSANASESRTTADLIAAVPGAAPAQAVSAIQFTAYVLIGAYAAKAVAAAALVWLTGLYPSVPGWSGPALAVAVAATAALLAGALPSRTLAPLVTVLAAFGLLVFFYVALAVIAELASGTTPVEPSIQIGAAAAQAEWGPAALVVSLAIAFAGFEIPTTANDRLRSVRRPLGYAVAFVALCATLAWVATNLGAAGGFRYDAKDLIPIALVMFGDTAGSWVLAATVAQAVAALLVLIWGAMRVIRPPHADRRLPFVVTQVTTIVLALLVSSGWADASAKFWGVAGLLLLVVYVLAAQANSRLDDSTTAWGLFALMGLVLVAVVFLRGLADGWWPVGIAAVILAAVAAWAAKRPARQLPRQHPPR